MKKIIFVIVSLLLLIVGIYLYSIFNLSKGEIDDSIRKFGYHKDYVTCLHFQGKVKNKKDEIIYNNKHRYWIEIKLTYINDIPKFGEQNFPTYYNFKGDSILSLVVTKVVFDKISINQLLEKKSDYFIYIGETKMQILNKKQDKWLP